jgi:hypothetical protein
MRTRTVAFTATEHASPGEAVQHLAVSGDSHAISLGGRHFTCRGAELGRLYAAGISPTHWFDRGGRLISVPGRD